MRGQGTHVSYKDVSWTTIKQLIPYLTAHSQRVFLALLCLVAAKIASIGLPFILKYIVDNLDQKPDMVTLIALPLGLLIAYGAVRLSTVLMAEVRDTLFGRVTEKAMHAISLKVFCHLHTLDLDFHLDRKTGGLSRDIERGTTGISFLLRFMIFNIIPTLLEIFLVMGILMFNYDLWFGVIIFFSIIIYVTYSVFATEIRTRYVRLMNKSDSNTHSRAVDSLLNYETVKYFTNEAFEANRYDKDLEAWETARRKNRLSVFSLNAGQALIISVSMTVSMILAAHHVTNNTMTLGDFVLINAFMIQIFLPLNFLGFVYREIKGSLANIESMFSLLKIQPSIYDASTCTQLEQFNQAIEFKDVCFSYDQNRPILNTINFIVPFKHKVAIVGSSGSGKSTLAKLLFRFYNCSSGKILIDNHDIKELTLHSLRKNIGVVPQECVLFNTSILENIRYGKIEATDEEVNKAIERAHLKDFIQSLPDGLSTIVGERGLKLSGGEKQRVAIARAILKNPPILLFDEATSSLDSHSESEILKAINEISGQRTSVVIAHRLSTISDADNIIVLDKGKIVEQGSHTQLLKTNGHYWRLWNIQQQEKDKNLHSTLNHV